MTATAKAEIGVSPSELARGSLLAFASAVDPDYKAGKPHALIAAALEAVAWGKITRLIIMAPPRTGKSRLTSEIFPAWWRGLNPKLGIVHGTYSQDLADDFGRKIKGIVGQAEYQSVFPGVQVAQDSSSMQRWHSVQGGSYYAVGRGGPVTGRGGHLLVLDDPYKNRDEADSVTIRDSCWNWWTSTFRTRLMHYGGRPGAIVIILTHWHEQDIAGMLEKMSLDGSGETWVVLKLRARAEEDDILGRQLGEPLWPEGGFDEPVLADLEKAMGPRDWAALFQQRPSSAEGNIFKRDSWRYWCEEWCADERESNGDAHQHHYLPEDLRRPAQSWDMSFNGTQESDYVCGLVGARNKANLYLLDHLKERLDLPRTITAVRQMTNKWPLALAKYVENKANGPAVIAMLQHEIPGLIPVEPKTIGGAKQSRWNAAAPLQAAGNVWLPRHAPWVPGFVESLAAVPASSYDDEADAFAQLVLKQFGETGRNLILAYSERIEAARNKKAMQGAATG